MCLMTPERMDSPFRSIWHLASRLRYIDSVKPSALSAGLCCVASLLLLAGDAAAEDGSTEAAEIDSPRHRVDFGLQWYDGAEGDIATGSLSYSWVPLDHHAFAATVLLVGSDVSNAEGSGIGDTRLQYSWVPSAKLTASGWLPKTLGTGFGLIVPTGDAAKGTGEDRWIAIPTLGWVFLIGERFSILPSLQYLHSFNEGSAGEDVSTANLEVGFLYVWSSGIWIKYTPSFFRDFQPVDDTNLDHFLLFGMQFSKIVGASLTLGSIERPPIQDPSLARSSDQFAEVTLHIVLPW
jgi:hypothetical protein